MVLVQLIYIPYSADKTSFVKMLIPFGADFISHIVQIKLFKTEDKTNSEIAFISLVVQIKRH